MRVDDQRRVFVLGGRVRVAQRLVKIKETLDLSPIRRPPLKAEMQGTQDGINVQHKME